MKKLIFSLFAIILLSYNFSFAQVDRSGGYARVLSMGNNPYLIDPEGIKFNPAWTGEYRDFIWGDLGSTTAPFGPGGSGQFLGVTFATCENFTVGAMLTRNDFRSPTIGSLDPMRRYNMGVVSRVNNVTGANNVVPLNNNVEAMVSYRNNRFTVGLGLAFATTTNETKVAGGGTSKGSASQFGVNAGVLARFTRNIFLDFGVSFALPSASFEPANGNKTEFKQTLIGATGRLYWGLSDMVRVIPSVFFINASGSAEANGTSGDMPAFIGIGFGAGFEYVIGNFKFIGGPAFNTTTVTIPEVQGQSPELKTSSFVFPIWNIGTEWYALDWLIARMGYVAITGNTTSETPATATTVNETTTTFFGPSGFTLGVGFRFGDFSLEATVNEDVLRQGFNNIGGGGATFAYLSTSYAF